MNKHEQFETNIEKIMREELENQGYKEGIDFETQWPIRNSFILDFAFPTQKLAIETDGPIHLKQRNKDKMKNAILKKQGWTVLRFWWHEIEHDLGECMNKIKNYL